ncbi:hypothetical protein PVAP13_6NG279900 [Panicum virgatum]|uniref:Uncharacterized protein n=1 Tax=Panicum virgatum TaxID=38727 RepID=A0A8T0R1L3_PANVG|nr:hypothetical protein PVAP13_6NG279900 [Panicum virgatum]
MGETETDAPHRRSRVDAIRLDPARLNNGRARLSKVKTRGRDRDGDGELNPKEEPVREGRGRAIPARRRSGERRRPPGRGSVAYPRVEGPRPRARRTRPSRAGAVRAPSAWSRAPGRLRSPDGEPVYVERGEEGYATREREGKGGRGADRAKGKAGGSTFSRKKAGAPAACRMDWHLAEGPAPGGEGQPRRPRPGAQANGGASPFWPPPPPVSAPRPKSQLPFPSRGRGRRAWGPPRPVGPCPAAAFRLRACDAVTVAHDGAAGSRPGLASPAAVRHHHCVHLLLLLPPRAVSSVNVFCSSWCAKGRGRGRGRGRGAPTWSWVRLWRGCHCLWGTIGLDRTFASLPCV